MRSLFLLPLLFSLFLSPLEACDDQLIPLDELSREKIHSRYFSKSQSEKGAIQYLIGLVRESNATFIRNGKKHTSFQAAKLLEYKQRKLSASTVTAEEFVRYAASYSSTSGEPYYLQYSSQKKCPLGRILINELEAVKY